MVRNVSKPTYLRSGHVLNSKLVLEPCKQFCICCKIYPKHDQHFIEHNFKHVFKTLHQDSYIRIAFLTNKHRKNIHKSHNFCG